MMKLKIKILSNLTIRFGDKIQVDFELPGFPDMGVRGILIPISTSDAVLTPEDLLAIRTQVIVAAKEVYAKSLDRKVIKKQLTDAGLSLFEVEV